MTMTDPIADLFTRVRNAALAARKHTDIPHSAMKEEVCKLLAREGFLREVQVTDVEGRKRLRAYLRTDEDGRSVIGRLERVSKPGCRVYKKSDEIERVLRGLGVGIYSTPKGLLTDAQCREQKVGGEYLGRIW
ncbi:MAG TPA: 30S ribosomal protein S8 [Planctomycetota bacterium]|nr:30S ribosomal protein S8 [Planctomycetota bacterium]